eukprot:TRINITY_DN3388_c0_g1_i1.p2 TRINITY_DN3388_c0_g1~~TRINITY_DN3388_c0_g1_i1.p2  ORF type:complete len:116 (-),score=30.49 TRINITY_DN3388_c0_g1_i1:62-409(-)
MSAYEHVVGGKLKMKGEPLKVVGEKKKKKKRKADEVKQEDIVTGDQIPAELEDRSDDEQDKRTDAEKRYEERMRERELTKIRKLADKSYREKVEEFNTKIAQMSEHYDIPKVGPG